MQVDRSEEKGVVNSPVYTEVRVEGGVLGPLCVCEEAMVEQMNCMMKYL